MTKNKICIIMPTRGRPVAQLEAVTSILGNSCGFADVLMVVDPDDTHCFHLSGPHVQMMVMPHRHPMLCAFNLAVQLCLPDYPIFGFTGDDVRYRTKNWDMKVWNILKHKVGVVYGHDGIQNERLPTHPWFSACLVDALGYAAPPSQNHYFFDNYLKGLTQRLGLLYWEPELVTEHLHHSVGGLSHDEVYQQAERLFEADKLAFARYCETQQDYDINRLKRYLKNRELMASSVAVQPGSHTP